jgi:hypothetical protein
MPRIDHGWQFSLAYLCLETLWVAVGCGFLTVLIHAPLRLEAQLLALPLVGSCWGAAAGGLANNMLEGSKAGLLAGFAFMLMFIALSGGR